MAAVDSFLLAEKARLERLVARFGAECDSRPKGSIVVKARGNQKYAYVVRREEGHVVTRYVGKSGGWKSQAMEAKLEERKRYERELKIASRELARIQRMLKAGAAFFY
jgi:hypothetical protein